jgi:5-formaminoimidazole-4-carboxamide-1-(beta)-D-ribofuranosyl 5'-monophosphate synthetase
MYSISTLGSHCALQVLKGAKDEGFKTMLICEERRINLYKRFRFIDRLIMVKDYKYEHVCSEPVINELKDNNCILVPHGTFIASMSVEQIERIDIPFFGNRYILRWEADRTLKERLMVDAGIRVPRTLTLDDLDNGKDKVLAIAKLHGAAGGKGYFLAASKEQFMQQYNRLLSKGIVNSMDDLYLQEYVIGVPVYLQYFYSPLSKQVELLGIDRRYESDADAISRIPAMHQAYARLEDITYTVIGNSPLVLRESLLDEAYKMGERFVDSVKRLVKYDMIGPFCIEGVYDRDGNFIAFEFSARIVAGTNLYINGSPYSYLLYDEPMSTGRRIAREIKLAIECNELDKVLT